MFEVTKYGQIMAKYGKWLTPVTPDNTGVFGPSFDRLRVKVRISTTPPRTLILSLSKEDSQVL